MLICSVNRELENTIDNAILSEEELADTASRELGELRRKINQAKLRVREQLDRLIKSPTQSKYLQETLVTQRDGRFVVPVKSEYRSEIKGLVHDTSASGATLFIEPMAVVEANNEIRVLQAKEKREIKRALAAGELDIICGTHAILQEDVEAKDLAFCVCDEQHRFGVAQRSALGEKSAGADMLVMSATPIPRTLSLIFYGDLDISEIKDKPKARAEIVTGIVPFRKYDDMLAYIGGEAKKGNQSYFVCPKIEGDEEGSLMSVTELFDELKNRLPTVRFALLHGKMKDREKSEIMQAFKEKRYDCLVSTTVIEVGIDVPDATIMVIYNAERFGLSQLRGRVGRGDKKSYCFLLLGSDSPEARERLSVIKNNTDGFKIAEYDLQMRGGGDFLGTRQSGKMLSEIRNLRYPPEVIFQAKKLADEAVSCADTMLLRSLALKKYESLQDVILN